MAHARAVVSFVLLLLVSCIRSEEPRSEDKSGIVTVTGEAYRDHCLSFESLDFGHKTAASLGGRSWLRLGDESNALAGVQVAAREISTGRIRYTVSGSDGEFRIDGLPEGEYDVWTCLDGFDELRFTLVVDLESSVTLFDLYLAPSESPGLRDVVAVF
jgi:hypothetical protein